MRTLTSNRLLHVMSPHEKSAAGVGSTSCARTQLPLKPPSARVLVTTRWHGTSGAKGLRRRACAACRSYSKSCRGQHPGRLLVPLLGSNCKGLPTTGSHHTRCCESNAHCCRLHTTGKCDRPYTCSGLSLALGFSRVHT